MKILAKFVSFVLFLCLLTSFSHIQSASALSFSVSRPSTNGYGIVDEREITMSVKLSDGLQPFDITFQVYFNGSSVYRTEAYANEKCTFHYMPQKAGDYRMEMTIRDQGNSSVTLDAKIPVSTTPRYEYPEIWEATLKDVALTGNLKDDLLSVARSQIGYTADSAFIFREGGKHFYSRYGEWYGAPYAEWCVMFISFCAHYANVPQSILPRDAGVVSMMNYMIESNAFHAKASDYIPGKGDIIFLDYLGSGMPTHAGIVESCTDGIIVTVEGNTSQGVASKSYPLDYEYLVGFGSFQTLAERAGL